MTPERDPLPERHEPLVMCLPALPASTPLLRRATARFAREHGADAAGIELAVAEAVANAVLHAYAHREPGNVTLTASVRDDAIEVVVADQGAGLVPRPDSPGLGLGLAIIAATADGFEVATPREGGTVVRMTFRIPATR